jgi:hypothetical protein
LLTADKYRASKADARESISRAYAFCDEILQEPQQLQVNYYKPTLSLCLEKKRL